MEVPRDQQYGDVVFKRDGKRCVSSITRTCQNLSISNLIETPHGTVIEEFTVTIEELSALAAAHHVIGALMNHAAADASDYISG